jgi:hypothetical protein
LSLQSCPVTHCNDRPGRLVSPFQIDGAGGICEQAAS